MRICLPCPAAARATVLPVVLIALPAVAAAEEATQALQPVFVTAARSAQAVTEVLAPITLITREDIERTQAHSLPELLARQPGIQFVRSGGPGAQTSLFVRGAGSSQVLVLVDGVRLNTALGGFAGALGGINLDTVERIEVVRGNLSSLYGSEAIGGVVQIFTRAAPADQVSVAAEAGSGDSASAAASVTHRFGSTRLSATLAGARSKPFSAIDPAQVQVSPPFVLGVNPDKDGNTHRGGAVQLTQRLGEDTELAANLWAQRNETDFDAIEEAPAATHRETRDTTQWQALARHRWSDVWSVRAAVAEVRDDSDNRSSVPTSFYSGTFEARNRQAQVQADAMLAQRVSASFGFDYLNQRGASTGYDPASAGTLTAFSRNVQSPWFRVTGRTDRQLVQISVRNDDYSDVGNASTGLLAYGYQLAPAWRATAQASSAFRAPSFNDLYFPGFGNPALQSEKARSVEAGLRYEQGALHGGLALFATRTTNLIQYSAATQRPENIARARVNGIELTLGWQREGWRADFNATYLDTEDEATGERLLRRAPLTANAALYYERERWSVGGEVGYTDRRSDSDINTFAVTELDAYTLLRLVAGYRLTPQLRLTLRLENVFDQQYELVDGYNTWGRSAFAGFEWHL